MPASLNYAPPHSLTADCNRPPSEPATPYSNRSRLCVHVHQLLLYVRALAILGTQLNQHHSAEFQCQLRGRGHFVDNARKAPNSDKAHLAARRIAANIAKLPEYYPTRLMR